MMYLGSHSNSPYGKLLSDCMVSCSIVSLGYLLSVYVYNVTSVAFALLIMYIERSERGAYDTVHLPARLLR